MKTEAEMGIMLPPAEESRASFQELEEARRAPLRAFGGRVADLGFGLGACAAGEQYTCVLLIR